MSFGPMQVMVFGFGDGSGLHGAVLAELRRLREQQVVRVVDMLVVAKDEDGDVVAVEGSGLTDDEQTELGAVVGALIGLGAGGEEGMEIGAELGAEEAAEGGVSPLADNVWYIADAVPPGQVAVVAVLEHQWAIPLRDAILSSGGERLADEWLHPEDLITLGAVLADGA